MKQPKYRLFQYAEHTTLRGKVIDLDLAEKRGMVRLDSIGRVISMSQDVYDLGNYTERGHRRLQPYAAKRYFGEKQ